MKFTNSQMSWIWHSYRSFVSPFQIFYNSSNSRFLGQRCVTGRRIYDFV